MGAIVAVDALLGIGLAAPDQLAHGVPADGLGGVRFGVVVEVVRANRVGGLLDFPFLVGLDHGTLDELIARSAAGAEAVGAELEAALAGRIWRAEGKQV